MHRRVAEGLAMDGALPLSALLGRALVDLTRSFEAAAPPAAPVPSLVLWSSLLRVATADPVPQRELVAASRLSRRAMASIVTGATRLGLVAVEPNPAGRGSLVRLAPTGETVAAAWQPLVAMGEAAWTAGRDARAVGELRKSLRAIVGQLDLEHPHYPTGYGPADPSMVGAGAVPAKVGPPRVPAHGKDWSPVVRATTAKATKAPATTASDVDDLPLFALLSQVLVAFAIDYEEHQPGPLATAANVLRWIPDGDVPLAELPRLAGVTGAGTSGLERHGVVSVTTGRPPAGPSARLTDVGRRLRDAYEPSTRAVEAAWVERHGAAVGELRAALESIDGSIAADRPHFPVVVFTGTGFAEVSALLADGSGGG